MVRPWIALISLLVLQAALLLGPASGEAVYVATANHPVKLVVNGEEVGIPAHVRLGDLVCAPESVYLDEGVRIVFRGWDGLGRDSCVMVSGNLTAIYSKEYLVHVYAEPRELRRSMWVEEGSFLELDYPEVYEESEGVRWVFQSWSLGETPFSPSNRIYVSRPLRVEADYVREFRVLALSTHGVRVNGSGWYREGALAVLAAPKEVYLGGSTRLVLREWVSAGSTPAIVSTQQSGVAVLEVRGPHVVMAVYGAEHLVRVSGPQGVLFSGWVGEGEEVRLATPEHIQLGQDTRLRFAGWRGIEGAQGPELRLVVSGPLSVEAAYVRQHLLSVSSPVGAVGVGWYDEGSRAVVAVPVNPPANIFVRRRLAGFTGDCDECLHSGGVMPLVMDRPRSVAAIYVSEPDLVNLGTLAGTVAAGGIAYATGKRVRALGPRSRKLAKQAPDDG